MGEGAQRGSWQSQAHIIREKIMTGAETLDWRAMRSGPLCGVVALMVVGLVSAWCVLFQA